MSERTMQERCGCRACLNQREAHLPAWEQTARTMMIVCPQCQNKRCPHADDHRHECTAPALATPEPGGEGEAGYWWCPECREEVDSSRVSYSEHHEDCGRGVIWKEPLPTPAASEDVRERLKTLIREGVEYRAKADGAYLYGPSVDATADRILDALSILTARGEAGGDSTDCPTCGDELAVYWEEGRIRGVMSLDQPARAALLRTPRGEGEAEQGPRAAPLHRYLGQRSPEGYGICTDCGARENTPEAARMCPARSSEAQGEEELAALVVHMWQLKEQRGPLYTESGDFYVDFRRAYQLAAARRDEAQGEVRETDLVIETFRPEWQNEEGAPAGVRIVDAIGVTVTAVCEYTLAENKAVAMAAVKAARAARRGEGGE